MYEVSSEQDERIDWGKTSADYARHRPGPPPSFYRRLKALDIGLPGQQVLDLGTGTAVIARHMAKQGCHVMASDISSKQIQMAKALAKSDGVKVAFKLPQQKPPAHPITA